MKTIETLFKHKNWFVSYNEDTNKYEPYLSKKLALQYFASTGDYDYDGKRLKYKGREGGTYKLNKDESVYYEQLLNEIKEALDYSERYIEDMKSKAISNQKKVEQVIVYKNILVDITVYHDMNFVVKNTHFVEYLQKQSNNYLTELEKLIFNN